MKQIASFLVTVALAPSPWAATWVVDNDTSRPADFRTAQAAHDAANAGDTLLFVGSGITYGDVTISKAVHFVGPGYNLALNGITSANLGEAVFHKITLAAGVPAQGGTGASGTTLSRLVCAAAGDAVMIKGGVEGLIIDKCKIGNISTSAEPTATSGQWTYVTNLIIRRSYCSSLSMITGGAATVTNSRLGAVYAQTHSPLDGVARGAAVSVQQCELGQVNPGGTPPVNLPTTVSCVNCVISSTINSGTGMSVTGSVLFTDGAKFPGNRTTISPTGFTEVYIGSVMNSETGYQHNTDPSNPAIGAGIGGVDAGMWAGAQPYRLSGVPSRPRVTHLSTSGVVSDTVGLTVQAGGEVRP